MSLKRVLPAVLLLLSVAPSAFAVTFFEPKFGVPYHCDYNNPVYPRINGTSTFVWQSTQFDAGNRPIHRTIEYFSIQGGQENVKATFAKPVNKRVHLQIDHTTWEFSVLNGVQCTQTDIDADREIVFNGCDDGSSRYCYPLQ